MRRVRSLVFLALAALAPSIGSTQANPVGPEFRVNTYTPGDQLFPAAAVDPAGSFVIVWSSVFQDGSYFGVFGQRYDDAGAPLGTEFRVNTYTTQNQASPSVATVAAGNFVVVWQSGTQDGSNFGVFGQRFASSGAPLGPEFRVSTYTTNAQSYPAVASDASGNFVVVWQSYAQDGSSAGIFGQRYASSGTPLGGEFRANAFTTDVQARPFVASDPSGNFVVVWESYFQDGSSAGIFGQRYGSSGAPVGSEFRVNAYTTDTQRLPTVASDVNGNFVVVWESYAQDGSSAGVFGQRYASSGTPLGAEFRLNTYTTSVQGGPAVASDSTGNFVVTWESFGQDGSLLGVFGQRYEGTGAPLGGEFRINTFVAGLQGHPLVAAATTGDFIVIWESQNQDGSAFGVFAQRFTQIVPVELEHFGVE